MTHVPERADLLVDKSCAGAVYANRVQRTEHLPPAPDKAASGPPDQVGGFRADGCSVPTGRLSTRSRRLGVVAAAVCALAGPASASESPGQVLSSSLAAARAQRSVHYVSISSAPTARLRIVGDAALDRGIQRITFDKAGRSGHATVLVVRNTAYVRGDAFVLADYMGFPGADARRYAGRWLEVPPTAAWYPVVSASVRLRSAIDELKLPAPLVVLPGSVRNGQRVIGVRSTSMVSGRSVTMTLYVQSSGPRLPVALVGRAGGNRYSATLGNWNRPVRVTAPGSATPMR